MAAGPKTGLKAALETIAARRDPRRLAADPLGLVREARDREGAALVAALLAFGTVASIRRSVAVALRALAGAPLPRGFRHRWIGRADLVALLRGLERARGRHGSLEALWASGDAGGDLAPALDRFCDALRGPRPSRGLRFLLPRPRDGSACKRPLLFLRWVARPDDGADLGLWKSVDPGRLVVPLDTHVHRIAVQLGLTVRRTPGWRTALEVTESLRAYDPADPVRFDFALAHLGILKDCPRRAVEATCAPCPLRPWCRAWAPGPPTTRSRARDRGSRPSSSPRPPGRRSPRARAG